MQQTEMQRTKMQQQKLYGITKLTVTECNNFTRIKQFIKMQQRIQCNRELKQKLNKKRIVMTKAIKNIFIWILGAFSLLFAGVFFAGCGSDYSKIQLVSSQSSVSLEVGESVDIVFTFENYVSSFSNKVSVNSYANGQNSVFSVTDPVYISDDSCRVTITAISGGEGQLIVKSFEGDKECVVDVSVTQYSSSMSFNNDVLYLSNQTDFEPTSSMFTFDANTTVKDVTFYYLTPVLSYGIDDYTTYQLVDIDTTEMIATFNNGSQDVEMFIVEFDLVSMEKYEDEYGETSNKLIFYLNGEEVLVEDMESQFDIMAIYDYSMSGDEYIYDTNIVYAFPDLEVEITGGYFLSDGTVEFTETSLDNIVIVPNNTNMTQYLIKIEMLDVESDFDVSVDIVKSNEYVVIDYYYPDESLNLETGSNIKYLIITQNSKTQSETTLSLSVYYEIAESIQGDDSVNMTRTYNIETQIAAIAITVNGLTSPETLNLYSYYVSESYGWNDLYIGAISGYATSPTFDGIYFTFNTDDVDIMYNGTTVSSGSSTLYTNLDIPFRIKGKDNTSSSGGTVVVHLVSSILEGDSDELTLEIEYVITDGAKEISIVDGYNSSGLYIDVSGGTQDFSQHLYTVNAFQSFTITNISGSDVVSFEIGTSPYNLVIENSINYYYLNISVTPKSTGTGRYQIVLDNGTSLNITFICVSTLTAETTSIQMSTDGNDNVTSYSYTSSSGSEFNNVLSIEIQNYSSNGEITYGRTASFEIIANVTSDDISYSNSSSYISVTKSGTTFKVTTRASGDATINISLTGVVVDNFASVARTYEITVYVSSYALVDSFYLLNGDSYALSNTVYTGTNVSEGDESVIFTASVQSTDARNFYQYQFSSSSIKTIFENAQESDENYIYSITSSNYSDMISYGLVYESYDQKFIYFRALDSSNNVLSSVSTTMTITKTYTNTTGTLVTQSRTITVSIYNALMFYADNFSYQEIDDNNNTVTYQVVFTNIFRVGIYGDFNLSTLTYTNDYPQEDSLVITAYLSQRNSTKVYASSIKISQYYSVESISLLSSMTEVNFTNQSLTVTIGVALYPTYATNSSVSPRVEFVTTNGNTYSNMLTWSITSSGNGVFLITLSCENFYNTYKNIITDINISLTGTIYIYPSEWGASISAISSSYHPIELGVHYRNGSSANPYLLETAEDVVAINADEISLKSHYEISTTVDMSSVTSGMLPIGILETSSGNYQFVGFTGSIIATSSSASITNVKITDNNFTATINGVLYAGLFAQINSGVTFENFTVSGTINISTTTTTYAGILTAINFGEIINVEVDVSGSSYINASSSSSATLYFGAVAGLNYGEILQDFTKYEGTGYIYKKYVTSLIGLGVNYENFAEDGDDLYYVVDDDGNKTIYNGIGYCILVLVDEIYNNGDMLYVVDNGETVRVNSNGFAIDDDGDMIKYDEDGSELLSMNDYSGQTSKNMAFFDYVLTINVSNFTVYAGGVAGISTGLIERISPVSSSYKLYNYSGYSAYTLITITGENETTSNNLNVGGIVGAVSYHKNSYIPSNISSSASYDSYDIALINLLVGGEISTLEANIVTANTASESDVSGDNVGGIVGIADTLNRVDINIQSNTSRVFLRGHRYVGGIVGNEQIQGNSYLVTYGSENRVEAVDDGRSSFYAALIIREYINSSIYTSGVTSLSELDTSTLSEIVSIGNAKENGRNDYTSDDSGFTVVSYSQRTTLSRPTSSVAATAGSTSEYYGDFLVVATVSDGAYTISDAVNFDRESVMLELSDENDFAMITDDENTSGINVFLAYYFQVTSDLTGILGSSAQDEIEDLNYISTNSNLYPFSLNSQDVSINVSSSNNLSVDNNGNLTVKGTGLATITLSSILNTNVSQVIYLYIVNYFDSKVSTSIFYTEQSLSSSNINSGGTLTIYGNSYSSIYAMPTYDLTATTADGDAFYISQNGVLTYKNVNYSLSKNTDLTIDYDKEETDNAVSTSQLSKQSIVFHKTSSAQSGGTDVYTLTPVLQITINGIVFYYLLENSTITLYVTYQDAATDINVLHDYQSMQSDGSFSETVSITSTNSNELLFYEIVSPTREVVQSRVPTSIPSDTNGYEIDGLENLTYEEFLNYVGDDLFEIQFTRRTGTNTFDFVCKINTTSTAYQERYKDGVDIYGEYVITFYTSELRESSVTCTLKFRLDEANLNYISVSNYSNINDISSTDEIVVPSQRGLLEITLDPLDSVFDTFTISNNAVNSNSGGGIAGFTLVYELRTQTGVTYIQATNFGTYKDNSLSFTYQQLIDFYNELEELYEDDVENELVSYNGKIYISYIMSSSGVEDGATVGFDVTITYGTDGSESLTVTSMLTAKLGSYARLVFDNKTSVDGYYYLAKGLSYNLSLDLYGYSEDQVTISLDSEYATLSGGNGSYVLTINSGNINYNSTDPGYLVTITITAQKIVDNVLVTYEDTLSFYIMEFVFNYNYDVSVNEDIVEGMEDGVINIAVGNPQTLELSIWDYLEYDSTNSEVISSVNTFVSTMTSNVEWKVYENGEGQVLAQNKTITSDYYIISSYTVTPLRIYDSESDLYYFSVSGYYTMQYGTYTYSLISSGANQLYTEFAFDVHNQSTQDSPIPIYDYEDFLDMQEGEWYILLADIELPNSTSSDEQFTPLNVEIAGLDGNNFSIIYQGTYVFDGLTDIGVFETIADGTIFQNVTISLSSDVVFKMNVETFYVGLLASTNNGIITNCSVESSNNSVLSVTSTVSTTSSYVAGFVAINSGYITNSRSSVNIYSNVNLAGFVGQNSGHIASSYYRGASLQNQTNTTNEYTAGFVIENSGQIYASYVSGDADNNQNSVYYDINQDSNEDTIKASGNISGFVYSNSGQIYDSYSNIHLEYSGFFASGFVFTNTGRVETCFSTSVLESNQTRNYGFVRYNNIENDDEIENGIFDCYYLSDSNSGVNVSLGAVAINETTDIETLTISEFGNMENFEDWVVVEGREINSVWFMNTSAYNYDNFNNSLFNVGRPELVSANIVATSNRALQSTETVVDSVTGAEYVKYVYVYTESSSPLGSVYNPILISDCEEFETYILQENSSSNYNDSYYRLISDVSYSEYLYNSGTYVTRFRGYFEGNFMEISGISLVSSTANTYAGLFAEIIGSSNSSASGTVMNFTISPTYVDFANTEVVGTVAGVLNGGTVVNVTISGSDYYVVGNNIVGGGIGLAIGNYKIQNLYSAFGAKARQQTQSSSLFSESDSEFSGQSYAGSIVGVLSGTGSIHNCVTDVALSVSAVRAGLMFGFVDSGATVSKVSLTMDDDMFVSGYTYAGLIVGESQGTISDVEIVGTGSEFTNFGQSQSIPNAIGGVAGSVSGGTISDVTTDQSISVSTTTTSSTITTLGGVVGTITDSATFQNISMTADLTGYQYVGGIAGKADLTGRVYFVDVTITGTLSAIGLRQESVGVGGVVGYASSGASIVLSGSDTDDLNSEEVTESTDPTVERNNNINVSIIIEVYTYNDSTTDAQLGGVVGYNESASAHLVYDTYVNLSDCLVTTINMMDAESGDYSTAQGVLYTDSSTGTIVYTSNVALQDFDASNMFSIIQYSATRSVFECSITYNTLRQDLSISAQCGVNMFGNIALVSTD